MIPKSFWGSESNLRLVLKCRSLLITLAAKLMISRCQRVHHMPTLRNTKSTLYPSELQYLSMWLAGSSRFWCSPANESFCIRLTETSRIARRLSVLVFRFIRFVFTQGGQVHQPLGPLSYFDLVDCILRYRVICLSQSNSLLQTWWLGSFMCSSHRSPYLRYLWEINRCKQQLLISPWNYLK